MITFSRLAKVKDNKISLRELVESDASEKYCRWLNDPEVNQYLETRESNLESVKEYIKLQKENPEVTFFGIFNNNNIHIGNLKLEIIDNINKIADFGIIIGDKKYWGKGIGTIATKLALKYAFEDLSLEKISLTVLAENKSAIRVYEKVGFKIVKIHKDKIKHGDKYFDDVEMIIER